MRDTCRARCAKPLFSGTEYATAKRISPFGSGNIQHPFQSTFSRQFLHGSAAGSRGMENQGFKTIFVQYFTAAIHARGGISKHGHSNRGFLRSRVMPGSSPAFQRPGCTPKHHFPDQINPCANGQIWDQDTIADATVQGNIEIERATMWE